MAPSLRVVVQDLLYEFRFSFVCSSWSAGEAGSTSSLDSVSGTSQAVAELWVTG